MKSERIAARGSGSREQAVIIGLNACVVTVIGETPHVLTVKRGGVEGLPFGSFAPHEHRTLQMGLRDLVREQTQLKLGYVEQLYTFGDRGRHVLEPGEGHRVVSVGYLALTRETEEGASAAGHWRSWYDFFPWEDWRQEKPAMIDVVIKPRLEAWAAAGAGERETRWDRAALCFAFDGLTWDEEQVLERYELMYEAGLVLEARRDKRALPSSAPADAEQARFGEPMQFDHRRILATGMGRLRSKLKYRPVVFELMEPTFTLLELQRTVEAITGVRLHKQNFRRLVESTGLVERTGRQSNKAGGRPAEQFRFRREVLRERPSPGVKVRAR